MARIRAKFYRILESIAVDKTVAGFKESDDSEKVIMEPKLIAIEYIKSWFFLDLLSSIPVDYIFLILDSGILDTDEVRQ